MAQRPKVAILGVDGADFAYYQRWIAKGLAPNFAKLAKRGRVGVLQSTYPPVTAPAWISFMTGQQPGSHGIVGFAAPSHGEYTRKVVNSSSYPTPTVWEIAGDQGSPCVVVNVPLTYPIRPVNGVLVAGMLTPEGVGFTHPPEFQPELKLLQPDYQIDLEWQRYEDRGHDLVRDQKDMTRARAELCVKLLQSKDWDFFMTVFTGTDRLQHCLHEHVMAIDDDEAVRKDSLTAAVRDYFVTLDEHIGDIMEAAGEDTNFIVISDHGFGPLKRAVYFNKWLADEGLLTLRKPSSGSNRRAFKRALNAVGVRRSTLTSVGKALGMGGKIQEKVQKLNPYVGGIDWDQTKVHYFPTNGFFVNLKGRDMFGSVEPGEEYEAVVQDLMRRLNDLKSPLDGSKLLPVVKRREDLFQGKETENLPDVFVEFLDQPFEAFMQDYEVPDAFMESGWANGTHRRNGLYIGAGPGLVSGDEIQGLEIFDVAPNILHLMGHPIPEHMDGRFREDLFEGGGKGATYEKFDGGGADRYGITDDEEKDLEEKLRGLGYL